MEKYIYFIKNRNIKQMKNYGKFVVLCLLIIFGLIAPWKNLTIVEKVILFVLTWVYLFFALLYASKDRMGNLFKKNKFYGWSYYLISLLFLYSIYRFRFATFNWSLLTVLIVSAVIQTILWIYSVNINIAKGNYNEQKPIELMGINYSILIQICIHVIAMTLINVIYISNGYSDVLILLLINCMYLLHWVYLVGLTFIYQNHIIKKHDLFNVVEAK